MVYLRRTYRFCCSHRYDNPAFDEAWNAQAFGKCNYAPGHGHNYVLEVILGPGTTDPDTGMLFELAELDRRIAATVIEPLDHRHLNHDVEHFATVIPTTEEIARYLFGVIDATLPAGLLHGLVLREDESLAAECYREGAGPGRGGS